MKLSVIIPVYNEEHTVAELLDAVLAAPLPEGVERELVVVDDQDMDVYNRTQMMFAMGSRWQPYPATEIIESARGMPLDPSSPDRPNSSKIIIDATRQWPEEGGPEVYPELNRTLLTNLAPESWDRIDAKWGDMLEDWQKLRRRRI